MNRETKRMLQRQGEVGPDGSPISTKERRQPAGGAPPSGRTGARQFLREVRGELRKVAWPGREEVVRYSTVVLVTLVIVTAMIAAVDFVFAKGVLVLFET